jgi:hypothetical protein
VRTGYASVMTDKRAQPEFDPSGVPVEKDEEPMTAQQSRAKADAASPLGPDADVADDEFTDPSAQPPP